MVLPIFVYGNPVLRKVAKEVSMDYPNLSEFIENMWETMYESDGIGLAAPQAGISIRMFVIDGSELREHDPSLFGWKKLFINPEILDYHEEKNMFNEGCLSIPGIREDVQRPVKIKIRYFDESFKQHTEIYTGLKARIIQHEYDHLEGILFVDKIHAIKKKMLKSKLNGITKGKFSAEYRTVPALSS
ncbi:peptide deformylase [Bacteroidota bacterium]